MCSRLHLEIGSNTVYAAPGDPIPYRAAGSDEVISAQWGIQLSDKINGFARIETFREKWLPYGWQPGTVVIENFAEGHSTPIWADQGGGTIAALHKDGYVLILTRQSSAAENRHFNHHRVPVKVVNGRADPKALWV